MRLRWLHILLLGVLLTTAFKSSCSADPSKPSAQSISANHAGQTASSEDEQLLRVVQQFGSSDEQTAWQILQKHDRSKLIEDLTRIANASLLDEHNRVLIVFTLCSLSHEYASNRNVVLSTLSQKPAFKGFSADWSVSLLQRLMIQGDKEILGPLIDASEWSDGAMGTELASAYSQALASEPETFLRVLSSRPEETRRNVMSLLKHNSLTTEEISKVKLYLRKVSRQSKLKHVAEQTLQALTN